MCWLMRTISLSVYVGGISTYYTWLPYESRNSIKDAEITKAMGTRHTSLPDFTKLIIKMHYRGMPHDIPHQGDKAYFLISFQLFYQINQSSNNLGYLKQKSLPHQSMAFFKPLLEPWLYSSSFLIDPLGPPVFVFASYVPASCHLQRRNYI